MIEALVGKKIVRAAGDNRVSAFITDKGELYTCGNEGSGVVGQGNTTQSPKPQLVESLKGRRIVDVSVGYTFMMILDGLLLFPFKKSSQICV